MKKRKITDQDLFQLDLLYLSTEELRRMGEVKVLDIMISNTQTFNPDGLFSTEIFGPIGNKIRNKQFGYISLGIPIMHPLVFNSLMQLRSLYKEIAMGTKYAKFNSKIGDFELSNMEEGETGYDFFVKHVPKIKFDTRGSDSRTHRIKIIKDNLLMLDAMHHFLVLPAGLRDYTIDDKGNPSEDEVNSLYRKLLATTQIIKNSNITPKDYPQFDKVRVKLNNIALEIYEHFKKLIDGKKKFVLGKFAKRGVIDGTRNVITPSPIIPNKLFEKSNIGINDTVIGLYQFVKAISPITKHKIHSKFITRIFNPETTSALLVDPKTLKSKLVDIPIKKRDEWLSLEGLDNIMNKLGQENVRTTPVMVDKYYLMLIYDDGKNIELIFNTDTIDPELDTKHIRPLTYAELFYLAIYDIKSKYPAYVTRYPIDNMGSVYPCNIYLKTTVVGRTIKLKVNGQWETVTEYPILKEKFVMSVSPHTSKIGNLGADYDGDTVSVIIVRDDESIEEIKNKLNDIYFYIQPNGSLTHTGKTDIIDYVLSYMTSFPEEKLSTEDSSIMNIEIEQEINSNPDKFVKTLKPVYNDANLKDWYYVHEEGLVFKVTKKDRKTKIHRMKPYVTKDGYLEYVLTKKDGSKKHIQGQIIVCKAFHGKPKCKDCVMEVNHKNGNRKDNHKDNLEWVTKSENIKHSFDKLGKTIWNKGKKKQPDGSYK